MIKAWRRPDGRYWLEAYTMADEAKVRRHHLVCGEEWSCRADQVDEVGAERMYGIVAGPSSCGCEPAGFRWVTASDVKSGRTNEEVCGHCTREHSRGMGQKIWIKTHRDIIDVCGEADEAESVYASEFAHKVGAIT